jgi:hypothetical protein
MDLEYDRKYEDECKILTKNSSDQWERYSMNNDEYNERWNRLFTLLD